VTNSELSRIAEHRNQRGPTTLELRAIIQKRGTSQATSNKIMCKTTDSQDLKIKSEYG